MNTGSWKITPATRFGVEDLLTEFAVRVDEDRSDTVHELFVESGLLETPAFKLTGRDEIHQRFSARARDQTRRTRHYWTNARFSGDESRIMVTTHVFTVINVEGQPTIMMGGTSHDVVVPCAAGWAFAIRRLEIAFEGTLTQKEQRP